MTEEFERSLVEELDRLHYLAASERELWAEERRSLLAKIAQLELQILELKKEQVRQKWAKVLVADTGFN